MRCIVGLGNPGKEYANSKHNMGFMVLDRIAEELSLRFTKSRFNALMAREYYRGEQFILLKPQTYMNNSGISVRAACAYYRIYPDEILLIYDDKDFALGEIKIRKEGGHGGHNGVRSVIAELGTKEFARMRVGIGQPRGDQIKHVLSPFSKEAEKDVAEVVRRAAEAALYWLTDTTDNTMNRYNVLPEL